MKERNNLRNFRSKNGKKNIYFLSKSRNFKIILKRKSRIYVIDICDRMGLHTRFVVHWIQLKIIFNSHKCRKTNGIKDKHTRLLRTFFRTTFDSFDSQIRNRIWTKNTHIDILQSWKTERKNKHKRLHENATNRTVKLHYCPKLVLRARYVSSNSNDHYH